MEGLFPRVPSGCAVFGVMSREGRKFDGTTAIKGIGAMRDRSNGLGGGFAAYGIYPEYKDYYCFHVMLESEEAKNSLDQVLEKHFEIWKDEAIPTRPIPEIGPAPILWRYFLSVLNSKRGERSEEDYIVEKVMKINTTIPGAFIASCGKNMGVFKGVGYPEAVGRFYRLEEYEGHIWTSHGRFPTNTVAWWGGAHPFSLLDWTVVHNGEISSYGTNQKYLENYGYICSMQTDTEVVCYLVDLLARKHQLPLELACRVMAAPLYAKIDRMNEDEKELFHTLRMVYASALLNGPFGFIIANNETMIGLTDRIKLRPMVVGEYKDLTFISSEESAIRNVCPSPDKIWRPDGGVPVMVRLGGENSV